MLLIRKDNSSMYVITSQQISINDWNTCFYGYNLILALPCLVIYELVYCYVRRYYIMQYICKFPQLIEKESLLLSSTPPDAYFSYRIKLWEGKLQLINITQIGM